MVNVDDQSALQWASFCGKGNLAKKLADHAIEAEMHQATAQLPSEPGQQRRLPKFVTSVFLIVLSFS